MTTFVRMTRADIEQLEKVAGRRLNTWDDFERWAVESKAEHDALQAKVRRFESQQEQDRKASLDAARRQIAEEDAAEARMLDRELRASLQLLPGEELI